MENKHKYTIFLWLVVLILVLSMGISVDRVEQVIKVDTRVPILYGYSTCGNDDVEEGEDCDDGDTDNGDGCNSSCEVETGWTCSGDPSSCSTVCGDGLIKGSEGCDDDGTTAGDGCSATCIVETGYSCSGEPSSCSGICGDGLIKGSEGCDDDGTTAGDGCSATCTVETGYSCSGEPSSCSTVCGDGYVKGSEECDDSDTDSGDGCSSACVVETGFSCSGEPSSCSSTCGDGVVASDEGCDDNDTDAGDGCSATCTVETGYACTGTPSSCSVVCGDGLIIGSEACDDGDADAGDGCSDTCTVETGFSCTGEPSSCSSTCGDGTVASDEGCDDSGTTAGDGCSATCTVESGYTCTGTPSSCSTSCGDGVVAGTEECEPPGSNDCSNSCMWATGGGGSSAGSSTSGRAIRRSQGGTVYIAPRRYGGGDPLIIEVLCGNDKIDIGEECDDGNQLDLDGCSSFCNREIGTCGDGLLQRALGEECEAESFINSKGKKEYQEIEECSEEEEVTACTPPDSDLGGCLLITLPVCGEPPPVADVPYSPVCGNGRKDVQEECDFGGVCRGGKYHGAVWRDRSASMLCRLNGGESTSRSGDGCDDECRLEYCGDGVIQFTEQCDNGYACSNNPDQSCTSNSECEGEATCSYNTEINKACTKTCSLCHGLYVTTLDVEKLIEGGHIVKVQVATGKGFSNIGETSFEVTKTLLLTQEPGPVHNLSVPMREASEEGHLSSPPRISIIMDKTSYIKEFNKAALVSVIVTQEDGSLITRLPIASFKLALNGKILEDQVMLESWAEECGTLAWESTLDAPPVTFYLPQFRE